MSTPTGTVTVSATIIGSLDLPAQQTVGPVVLNQAAAVESVQTLNLASGNNTITLPPGTTVVIVILPAANAFGVTLKGVNGDTGINLGTTGLGCVLQLNGVTAFVLNAAGGAVNGVLVRSQ